MVEDHFDRWNFRAFYDDASEKSGSGTTVDTMVTDGSYWDGEEESHPYTMAGIGLTGEEEDPCKIDKIKARELDYDDISREHGSGATINTTEEPLNSFRNQIDGVRDGPYWDGGESHPYTMAGIGLTGEDEDPCKIDKIKTRARTLFALEGSSRSRDTIESEDSTLPADVSDGGQGFKIRYASEDDGHMYMYIQRLKNHPWKEVEYYRKSDSLFAAPKKKEFDYTALTKLISDCYFTAKKVEHELVTKVFQEPGVVMLKSLLVQGWLPRIPETIKQTYQNFKQDQFFRDAYFMIQHHKIGLAQITKDQNNSKGPYFKQFKQLREDSSKVVNEFKTSIKALKLNPGGQKVQTTVMTDDYRVLKTDIARNFRDYVIVTQYIKALNYISRSLCYLRYRFA